MRVITRHDCSPGLAGKQRPGFLIAAELLFVLPILMMFLLGVVQFYMLVETRIDLLNASRAGARVAASGGHAYETQVNEEVEKTVHRALGNGRLSKFARVHVTWSQDLNPPPVGEPDWVQVEVDVRAGCVIPDVLGWVGFTIGNKRIVAATLMKQE